MGLRETVPRDLQEKIGLSPEQSDAVWWIGLYSNTRSIWDETAKRVQKKHGLKKLYIPTLKGKVMTVAPKRNETATIGAFRTALLSQHYPLQFIGEATGVIVEHAARQGQQALKAVLSVFSRGGA